jgi:hypothetical protein
VPGQLDDALTTVEGPQDDIAPGGIRQGGKDVVGVERGGSYIQPYGCMTDPSRGEKRCVAMRRSGLVRRAVIGRLRVVSRLRRRGRHRPA